MFHTGKPVGWGVKHQASAKSLAKTWPDTTEELHAFLEWSVQNWSMMMAGEFRWMKQSPNAPDIHFLKRHVQNFREVREQNTGQAWRTGPRAMEISMLLMAGKDDEAHALIEEENISVQPPPDAGEAFHEE